jgi:S-adenosylmethionine:tRNA ribosyltransferase-isomerase
MGHSLKEFNITVPDRLIAQYPAEERQGSRLLVLDARDGSLVDEQFRNIDRFITARDCLVYNDARVINARLYGRKRLSDGAEGARIEILLTRRLDSHRWRCLIRPGRRVRAGTRITLDSGVALTVYEDLGDGSFAIRFPKSITFEDLLQIGEIPLPRYIRRNVDPEIDGKRYQTVYSKHYGAVAAPTAGLHFTEEIIGRLKRKGALFVPITLHVDWGTFMPVREEDYRDHVIHRERYELSARSATLVNESREQGRRIVCVGTTSIRALETATEADGRVRAGCGETGLYIYPGYSFKTADALITNFHMPDSTLILLVAAFAGKKHIERAYHHAVSQGYRFFSYGDAMFIHRGGMHS